MERHRRRNNRTNLGQSTDSVAIAYSYGARKLSALAIAFLHFTFDVLFVLALRHLHPARPVRLSTFFSLALFFFSSPWWLCHVKSFS